MLSHPVENSADLLRLRTSSLSRYGLTEEGEQSGVVAVRRLTRATFEDVVADHPGVGTVQPRHLVRHVAVSRGDVEENVLA